MNLHFITRWRRRLLLALLYCLELAVKYQLYRLELALKRREEALTRRW